MVPQDILDTKFAGILAGLGFTCASAFLYRANKKKAPWVTVPNNARFITGVVGAAVCGPMGVDEFRLGLQKDPVLAEQVARFMQNIHLIKGFDYAGTMVMTGVIAWLATQPKQAAKIEAYYSKFTDEERLNCARRTGLGSNIFIVLGIGIRLLGGFVDNLIPQPDAAATKQLCYFASTVFLGTGYGMRIHASYIAPAKQPAAPAAAL